MTPPSFRDPTARRGPEQRADVLAEGSGVCRDPCHPSLWVPSPSPGSLGSPSYQNLLLFPTCLGTAPPTLPREQQAEKTPKSPCPNLFSGWPQSCRVSGDEGSGPPSSLGQHLRLLPLQFPLPLWATWTGMALSALRCPHSKMAITISALAGPPGSPGSRGDAGGSASESERHQTGSCKALGWTHVTGWSGLDVGTGGEGAGPFCCQALC